MKVSITMKKMINNKWAKAWGSVFVLSCMDLAYVNGSNSKTLFIRQSGGADLPITCAVEALSVDEMKVSYNTANTCENYRWEQSSLNDGISTYYEKLQVIKVYKEPVPLRGTIRLPIPFVDGAYINMHIEFTSVSVSYGCIRLLDTLFDTHDVYDDIPEVVMTSFELIGGVSLSVQSFNGWWNGRLTGYPMPFQTGIVYKITFKALGNDLKVLINDGLIVQYTLDIPSSYARVLYFHDFGMLLHEIEFVA